MPIFCPFPGAPVRTRSQRQLFIAAVAVAALAACGKSDKSTTGSTTAGPLASITISPLAPSITIGDTLRLVALSYDAKSTLITTDTLTWSTSDSSVATVSDSGTVNALSAGTAKITAKSASILDTVIVTVTPPVTQAFLSVTAVAAGFTHTCALVTGGTAYCWGNNASGQLGNDTTVLSALPLTVSGGRTFASLTAGYSHTCGIGTDGVAYCWGDNASGALGATTANATTGDAVAVSGGHTFVTLSAGYSHTCGLTAAGVAYCWGANESGELGDSAIGQDGPTPQPVSGGLTFASISAGGVYTCGVTKTGAGYCWGSNGYGVLGNGTTTDSPVPVAVAGGLTFASITAGVYHTCGLTTNGAAYCWGNAGSGQLGTGLTSLTSSLPLAVAGGHTFVSLTVAENSTCGVAAGGAAYCWGDGTFGALGTGTTTQATTPTAVSGTQSYVSVTSGISFHVCGLTTGGAVYCWGYNDNGELGDASAGGYSVVPVQVVVPRQ